MRRWQQGLSSRRAELRFLKNGGASRWGALFDSAWAIGVHQEVVAAGEVAEGAEAELGEEGGCGGPEGGAAWDLLAASRFDQPGFQEGFQGGLVQGGAADGLDLGAGDGLVIGDDGEGLHGSAGEAAGLGDDLQEAGGEVWGGAEVPAAGDFHQFHTAAGVASLEVAEDGGGVGACREGVGDGGDGDGLGAGEDQGFGQPFGVRWVFR